MNDDPLISLENVNPPRRLDDYFGLWAIEPRIFGAMFNQISHMDIPAHIAVTPAPRLQSHLSIRTPDGAPLQAAADGGGNDPNAVRGKQIPVGSIAVINASGTLMKQVGSMDDGTSTVQLRRDIRTAADNPNIAGILLVVDSPGGTVSGTSDLADDVGYAASKKPTYALAEDLCASAAYWIASAAQKLFATNPTALIGSIGTYAGMWDLSGSAAQKGIKAKLYSTGSLKGAGFPGKEITPEQDQYFQSIVDQTQTHFAAAVARNRGMTPAAVAAAATGAVFPAQQAQKMGLIDGIKSFDDSLAALQGEIQKQKSKTGAGSGRMSAASETPEINTEVAMTDKNPTTAAEQPPVGASLKEIKAALPKASSDFLVQAVTDNLTVAQAKDRYIEQQEAALEQARAENKKIGTQPVGGGGSKNGEDASAESFEQLVAAKMEANPDLQRREVIKAVAKAHPEAHQAFVENCPRVVRANSPAAIRAARAAAK